MKALTFVLIFILDISFAKAQQKSEENGVRSTDSSDQMINVMGEKFVTTQGHYGLSIGVIKNGRKCSYHFGTTDKNKNIKPNDLTIYEIASVTKSFTGILLAQAILEKRISLDDDIHKYLHEPYPNLTYKGIPIKIGDLASHSSGLPKFLPGLDKDISPEQLMNKYVHFSEAEFLERLSEIKLDTIPGKKFIYSNADAQLIGIILEKVYQVSYGDLLKKYITCPQQMTNTKLEIQDTSLIAKGYNNKGELMPRLDWWKMTPAAGYVKSNISDMLKYLQFNMGEQDPAIKLAHQPIFKVSEEGADSIGLFWFIKKTERNEKVIYHAGGSFGTTSYCEIRPDQQHSIIIFANDSSPGTEQELKDMASQILKSANK